MARQMTLVELQRCLAPLHCNRCGHDFDGAKVHVIRRLPDASVFKCPSCRREGDDRPDGYGGFKRVDVAQIERLRDLGVDWRV